MPVYVYEARLIILGPNDPGARRDRTGDLARAPTDHGRRESFGIFLVRHSHPKIDYVLLPHDMRSDSAVL